MPLDPDTRPAPRKLRGPEPLRRKRVEPTPLSAVPGRRKVLNLLLAFAAVVLLIDALVGEKGLMESLRARRSYAQAEAGLRTARAENARLRENVRRLRDEPSAIEAIARDKMGFIRPGELLFIVRDVQPASPR